MRGRVRKREAAAIAARAPDDGGREVAERRGRSALLDESGAGLELLGRTQEHLDALGGAGELRPLCDHLRQLVARDEAVVELTGPQRALAMAALIGVRTLDEPAE